MSSQESPLRGFVVLVFLGNYGLSVHGHPQSPSFDSSIRYEDKFPLPGYVKNANLDQWATETSKVFQTVPAPKSMLINKSDSLQRSLTANSKFGGFLGDNHIPDIQFLPLVNLNESEYRTSRLPRNRSSRFFSIDPSTQALNLGVSFNVPFISIPTSSLLSFGQTATTALSELISMNLPSIAMTTIVIGIVMFLLPKIMTVLISFLTQYGMPGSFKSEDGISLDDNVSSYTSYMRSIEVAPFTSIINQIEEAMKEYNLDSTSCMQRVVCSYVSEAEEAVSKGTASPSNLILKGLTKSSWAQKLLGDNALTEALEVGTVEGVSCSRKFPKCPFSLHGVVGLLSSYVNGER